MSAGSDTVHKLRVSDGEYEIVHVEGCPTERVPALLGDVPYYVEFSCSVGGHVAMWGFDDLSDENGNMLADLNLPNGDYPLVLDWYTPDSMFEDSEVNFFLRLSAGSPKETDAPA